jgi:cyanosortase A-associated protein
MAQKRERWHGFIICLQAIAVAVVGLKLLLQTTTPTPEKSIISLPSLHIKNWRSLSAKNLSNKALQDIIPGEFQGGREESFTKNQQILTVRRATLTGTNGDLKTYIKGHSSDLFSTLKYQPDIGHYSQFFDGDRLTMTACITKNNRTTVTADQFKIQQIRSTFSFPQLSGWLLNRHHLMPNICHWQAISLYPVDNKSHDLLLNLWQTIDKN